MKNTNYINYSIHQLAEDPDFLRWVLHPGPKDLIYWQDFLAAHKDQTAKITLAYKLVKNAHEGIQSDLMRPDKKQQMHDRLINNIRQKGRRNWRFAFSIAAAVLLLLLAYQVFWEVAPPKKIALIEIKTPYGQTREVILPDGSKVVLNANSNLSYPQKWEEGVDRRVWLNGEAHFSVKPQLSTQAKFTVSTNNLNVNVLGTIFNIYAREQKTIVTLEEGKITLNLKEQKDKQAAITMKPGSQLRFSTQTGQLTMAENVNTRAHSSWKDGIITFDGITLGQLGEMITEIFGIPVQFKNPGRSDQMITGAGQTDDLNLLLETVQKAFDIEIIRKDSLLIFE